MTTNAAAASAPPEADEPSAAALRSALREHFRRLEAGDLEALDDVWEACADRLYGLALWRCGRVAEAADAVQETWMRLARTARDNGLRHVDDPLAYLFAVARRCAVDQVRRRRDHDDLDELTDADLHLLTPASPDPEAALDARRAGDALRGLPADQRDAVYLRLFGGLTFREVGEATDVPQFTAASRFRLGIEKLRRLLTDT